MQLSRCGVTEMDDSIMQTDVSLSGVTVDVHRDSDLRKDPEAAENFNSY